MGFTFDFGYEIEGLNAKVAFLTLNDFRIEIFEIKNASSLPESSRNAAMDLPIVGLKHIAISVDNLKQMVARLKSQEVEVINEIREVTNSNGQKFVFFKDNNGILMELYQKL